MASLSAVQRTPQAAATPGGAAAAPLARRHGTAGELLRSPSIQQQDSQKKAKRAQSIGGGVGAGAGGMRRDSLGASIGEEALAAAAEADGGGGAAAAATPAAAAAAEPAPAGPAAAAQARGAPPGACLLGQCGDAVAALVGAGYLLLSAVGWDRRTPRALSRLVRRASLELAAASPRAGTRRPAPAG